MLWDWPYFVKYSPHWDGIWRIFHRIMSIPHSILMYMNNVVHEKITTYTHCIQDMDWQRKKKIDSNLSIGVFIIFCTLRKTGNNHKRQRGYGNCSLHSSKSGKSRISTNRTRGSHQQKLTMIAHVKRKTMPPTFPHLRNIGFLTTPNEKWTTLNMIFSVIWYFMSLWAILHYGPWSQTMGDGMFLWSDLMVQLPWSNFFKKINSQCLWALH